MAQDRHDSLTHEVAVAIRRRFWSRVRWFRRLSRWQRWCVRFVLASPLLLTLAVVVVTRSPLAGLILIPRLEAALNLTIDADSVFVRTDGQVQVNRAEFRIPAVRGPAGLLLRVERLTADVDWWATIFGSPRVRRMEIDGSVTRVSQSIDDGTLNLSRYVPPAAGGNTPLQLPVIVARHAAIELGEHQGTMYSALKRLPVEGSLRPARGDRAPSYAVSLREIGPAASRAGAGREGFRLEGTITGPDISVTMDNFSLDAWPSEAVPTPSREVFADLNVAGLVNQAIFTYTPAEGVSASLVLDNVALSLPIEPEDPELTGGRPMRMHGVSGRITFKRDSVVARLVGNLEDLPYEVTLLYDGVSEDSPFTCELISKGFRVETYPKLLPYATDMVRYRLRTFSGPTATLDTRLILTRGAPSAPGVPGEIEFQGWIDFRDGSAAFERFPYRFEGMSGRVYVDSSKIEIIEVRGVSPTGARLLARGTLAPPTDDAKVDIFVTVEGAPIDNVLEKAFGEGRRELMTALFNKDKYQQLLDRGLVLTPAEAGALGTELEKRRAEIAGAPLDEALRDRAAELERRLQAPVFRFGGRVDVDVHVHRPFGPDVEWLTTVDVRIPEAGLVPEKFPFPVHAEDIRCKVVNDRVELIGGTYAGLRGGSGEVTATFRLPSSQPGDSRARPDVHIVARSIPMDELLVHALPGPDSAPEGAPRPFKQMLRGLGVAGPADAIVRIAPRDVLGREGAVDGPEDDTGFDADVRIADATVSPLGGPTLMIGAGGVVRVTEEGLELAVSGRVPGGDGRVHADVTAAFGRKTGAGVSVDAVIKADALDARTDVERAVAVFSEAAAADLGKLRETYRPEGSSDSTTEVTVRDDRVQSVLVTLTGANDASFDLFGGRVTLGATNGVVRVRALEGPTVEYESFRAPVTFDGVPSGVATLTGARRYRLGPGQTGPSMNVHVVNAGFDSPMVPAVLRPALGPDRLQLFASIKPRGLFDASIDIAGIEPLKGDAFSGWIRPHSLACELDGGPVAWTRFDGRAEFRGATGRFVELVAGNDVWTGTVDGTWAAQDGGVLLDLNLDAAGSSLTPDALAVLPAALRRAAADLALRIHGPYELEDARLRMQTGAGPDRDHSKFHGQFSFEEAALEAGVAITGCTGRLEAEFEQIPGAQTPPNYTVRIIADRMRLAKASATNGRTVVMSGQQRGEVLIPLLQGECHGGRFSGQVRVAPAGEDGLREYATEFQAAGVDFGAILSEFAATDESEMRPVLPRGILDGQLSLGGTVGVAESRRGRGSVRVAGKNVRVLDMPLVVSLIEVSNLQPPSNDELDFAQAMFFVDGPDVTFEDLAIISQTVEIRGYGMMTWPEMELNLRFDSRSARPVPVLSWVLEGIRDQLVTTRVTGKPAKPKVRVDPIPGTRRAFGQAIGASESDASRRLAEIGRRAAANRRTIRPSGGAISATPAVGSADGERDDPE